MPVVVPVCRSPEDSTDSAQNRLSPGGQGSLSPRHSSPVSTKRPAPPPPVPRSEARRPVDQEEAGGSEARGTGGQEEADERHKSSRYLPWRSAHKSVSEATSPDANVHKVSSSDDIQTYKKPEPGQKPGPSKFTTKRRPASIATSKPARPQAPPPKPPSSRKNSHDASSPDDLYLYDDAAALRPGATRAPLADIRESLSPGNSEEK